MMVNSESVIEDKTPIEIEEEGRGRDIGLKWVYVN